MSFLRLQFYLSAFTVVIQVVGYELQVSDDNGDNEDDGTNVCIAMVNVVFHFFVYP